MNIHPTAVVTDGVELGERVIIGPQAVVLGPCRIGDDVRIGPGCVIGSPPEIIGAEQNSAWAGQLAHHGIHIGARTVVRELCSVQQGSLAPTVIGADCWLLSRAYIAHDCALGDGVTVSAGVALGGYVAIGERATLGMNATVHQRRIIGPGAMVGMSAAVTRDVPPWAKSFGNPARLRGANVIGMTRRGVDPEEAAALDRSYRTGDPAPTATDPELRAALEWWTRRNGALAG